MAFTNIPELTADRGKYLKQVKTEFTTQLKSNTIQKFYYYDGIDQGGSKIQMLLFGKVPAGDLKTLKDGSTVQAMGECFIKDDLLNIILSKGKIKEDRLEKLMKEIGPKIRAVLSDGLEANPTLTGAGKSSDPEQEQADNIAAEARKAYGRIPKGMVGGGVEALRKMRDEIEELADEDPLDLPDLRKRLKALETAVDKLNMVKPEGPGSKTDRAAEDAAKLWDKVMERFDKVKALITDEERGALRKKWGEAETAREKLGTAKLVEVLNALDAMILKYAKLAMEAKAKQVKEGNPDPLAGSEAERLVGVIEKKVTWVKSAEKLVNQERGALEKIRYQIMEMKEKGGDPSTLLKDFDVAEKRLNGAREALDKQRREHAELLKRLEKAANVDPNLKRIAEQAEKDMSKLDKLFDDIPVATAKAQIKTTLEEMGAAIEWREKQLKQEISDGKHGIGRHGPQTGLEGQGVRAATSEAYLDTNMTNPKVKARGPGVTPDSASNPSGTAQRSVDRDDKGKATGTTVRWNAIDITYAEEDGKRVITDVDKTAKSIAASGSNSGASLIGSLWATPVLEKRAFDIVDGIAKKLAKYEQYKKTGPGYNDFKTLEITLGQAESGGAGWGYMMKKKGKQSQFLDEPTAKKYLHEFQDGDISLDELFKKLNVKLADTDENGKNMVMGVTAIYRRANKTDDFKLVTMYPNNEVDKLEWRPNKDYTGTLEFKGPPPVGSKTFNMLALP